MQKIKIIKTIEEMPMGKAINLCLQISRKPKCINQKDWESQIRKDLLAGKKLFKIRELILNEKGSEG